MGGHFLPPVPPGQAHERKKKSPDRRIYRYLSYRQRKRDWLITSFSILVYPHIWYFKKKMAEIVVIQRVSLKTRSILKSKTTFVWYNCWPELTWNNWNSVFISKIIRCHLKLLRFIKYACQFTNFEPKWQTIRVPHLYQQMTENRLGTIRDG